MLSHHHHHHHYTITITGLAWLGSWAHLALCTPHPAPTWGGICLSKTVVQMIYQRTP